MSSPSEDRSGSHTRVYDRRESVVFLKTHEEFGGLSNMAGGFPLKVNGVRILTSEALYQACRFPQLPEVQRLIIEQKSPMTAKMKSKPYRTGARHDWDAVRVRVMRWCLRVKLAQNLDTFSRLLLETGNRSIVEESRRDAFWGAKPVDERILVGANVLGRLLMELREAVKAEGWEAFRRVEPLGIQGFLLGGRPIEAVTAPDRGVHAQIAKPAAHGERDDIQELVSVQQSLFDQPAVTEVRSSEYAGNGSNRSRRTELRPYPRMKDSGVPWLGEVPEHWDVLPNRAILKEVKERDHPEEQMLSVTITRGVIRQQTLLSDSSKKDSSNQDKSAYKLVQPGDITYNKMRAWQGSVGVSEYRGIVSPAYVVQRPREGADSRYLHYLLRTPAFAKEAERWSYGITSDMWSLRPEHFRMIYACRPPFAEQTAMLRFLDHADRRIRRYIAAKKKLIALLNEQKQAIIHRAVTRGLDPSVKLRPSGVEWLGEVPEHWEVAPLRRRWTVTDCKHLTVPYVEDGIPLASVREVQSFDLDLSASKRTTTDWYESLIEGGRAPGRGDIVYCRNVVVGAAAFVDTDARFAMGQDVCLIRSPDQSQRYLNYSLHSPAMERQLAMLLIGSTFKRINVADIKNLMIAIPPRAEQDAIAAHLDETRVHLDGPISQARLQIELMREYRTRLIADVVTGKLDVREAAAHLPDEVEEAELFDDADDLADGDESEHEADLDAVVEEVVA